MKKLPEINESFKDLYRLLLTEPIRAKFLSAGIELKVFNQLSEPRSAKTVAEAIDTQPDNTRLLLDALSASELVVKKNGLYQNIPTTQAFLVEDSPTYLGQTLNMYSQFYSASLNELPRLIKEGSSLEMDLGDEEMWKQSIIAPANYEQAGMAQIVVKIVSNLHEFASFRKMLDLGAGPGIYTIAILSSHPDLKAVMFDRVAVVEEVKKFIKKYEMEERIEVLAGDYNHDSMALDCISMALIGQDMCFDQGFIADSINRSGFKSVRSRTLNMPAGPMDIDIGRKA